MRATGSHNVPQGGNDSRARGARRFGSPLSACNAKRWRTMGEGCAAIVPLPRIAGSSAAPGSQHPPFAKRGGGVDRGWWMSTDLRPPPPQWRVREVVLSEKNSTSCHRRGTAAPLSSQDRRVSVAERQRRSASSMLSASVSLIAVRCAMAVDSWDVSARRVRAKEESNASLYCFDDIRRTS